MDDVFSAAWTALAGFLAVAVAGWVLPSVRWARSLKRDLDIYAGLPDGQEKRTWLVGVEQRARRLRRYPREVPRWQRATQVGALFGIVLLLITLGTTVVEAFKVWAVRTIFSGDVNLDLSTIVQNWSPVVVILVFMLVLAPFAIDGLRGRPIASCVFDPLNWLRGDRKPGLPLPEHDLTDPVEIEAWLRSALEGRGYKVEKLPAEGTEDRPG